MGPSTAIATGQWRLCFVKMQGQIEALRQRPVIRNLTANDRLDAELPVFEAYSVPLV